MNMIASRHRPAKMISTQPRPIALCMFGNASISAKFASQSTVAAIAAAWPRTFVAHRERRDEHVQADHHDHDLGRAGQVAQADAGQHRRQRHAGVAGDRQPPPADPGRTAQASARSAPPPRSRHPRPAAPARPWPGRTSRAAAASAATPASASAAPADDGRHRAESQDQPPPGARGAVRPRGQDDERDDAGHQDADGDHPLLEHAERAAPAARRVLGDVRGRDPGVRADGDADQGPGEQEHACPGSARTGSRRSHT